MQKNTRMLGWESVCWWVVGIPLIEQRSFNVSKFLGFFVSRFRGFLVSWFLFALSLRFKISKLQRYETISCSLEDVGPILPNFHFISGRYWSHIQGFWEMLRRIFRIFGHASFPTNPKLSISKILRIPNLISFKSDLCFFWNYLEYRTLVSPKSRIVGFGSHDHVRQVRKPWKWCVFGFS